MSKRTKQSKPDNSDDERTTRRRRRKAPRVPPPDSPIWPEQYRGKNWKSIYAILFAGRCQLCVYSCPLPRWRQLRDKFHGETRLLLCTNHPDRPGELLEVLPIETCRNFKPKQTCGVIPRIMVRSPGPARKRLSHGGWPGPM